MEQTLRARESELSAAMSREQAQWAAMATRLEALEQATGQRRD